MNIPDRIVTKTELRRTTGERGIRKFIAYKGIAYDVTDCPKWRGDLHEEDVFTRPCIIIIGRMED